MTVFINRSQSPDDLHVLWMYNRWKKTNAVADLQVCDFVMEDRAHEPFEEEKSVKSALATGFHNLIAKATEVMRAPADPDVFEQPPGSDVQVETYPDGITLRIPPAGIWKGSAGLFQFGIIWCALTGGFTLLFLIAGIAQGAGASGILGVFVVMGVFWSVGGLMLYFGWMMGTRESVVAVVSGSLMVLQTGPRRAKRREWPPGEVKTVRVGPSGIEVNDKDVIELQMIGANGKLYGMLAGRDQHELAWMATLLRQVLKSAEASSPANRASSETETP